jgi:hypothetical protein
MDTELIVCIPGSWKDRANWSKRFCLMTFVILEDKPFYNPNGVWDLSSV